MWLAAPLLFLACEKRPVANAPDAGAAAIVSASASAVPETKRHDDDLAVGAEAIRAAATKAQDGKDLSGRALVSVAHLVAKHGAGVLDKLPAVTYGEALKDADEARGKVVTFTGTVREIKRQKPQTDGGLAGYSGGMSSDAGRWIFFWTPLSTDGIEDGKEATFRGVFIQENDAKARGHMLTLVGAFDVKR